MNNTESQTPINSFTLAELIDLAGEQRQGLMRECITASSDSQMQVFRFPCRIDAFIIGVGTEGETSVSFNLHEFRLKKDSMFIFTPKNILQVNSQQYFKADVIAISPDFMRRINIDIKNMMPLFLKFVENPALPLTPEEIAYFHTSDERVSVATLDGRTLPVDRSLDTLMGQLPAADFYRANRQFIVSRRAIADLSVWFGSRLTLNLCVKTPERIVISKARVPEFKRWFLEGV